MPGHFFVRAFEREAMQMEWPIKEKTSPGRFHATPSCLRGSSAI
jgi:hypothetical protein